MRWSGRYIGTVATLALVVVAVFALGGLLGSGVDSCLDAEVPMVSNDLVSLRVQTGPMSVREVAEFATEVLGVDVRPPCPRFDPHFVITDLALQGVPRISEPLPPSAVWTFGHSNPDPNLGDIPPTFGQLVVYSGVVEMEEMEAESFDLGVGESSALMHYEFRDVPLVSGPGDRELRTFVINSGGRTITLFVSSPAGDLPAEADLLSFLRAVARD